jgi:hypothetical protein
MSGGSSFARAAPTRALIVTADDFGLHPSVNMAVERAHREGILTAASLMVGAPAAGDAIARARSTAGLRVGLHLVLADGASVLPPRALPDLVDANGRFGTHMIRDGVRFFCLPRVRRQLELEIRAQFEAFAASGLPLDHVNAHKHFHVHPTILSLVIRIGHEFGMAAVRLPRETGPPARTDTPSQLTPTDSPGGAPTSHPPPRPPAPSSRDPTSFWLRPWLALMAARLDTAGVVHNDFVIGIRDSGRVDETTLLTALRTLPPSGLGELYLHPALESGAAIAPSMRGYRHADEFTALIAPRVRAACAELRAAGWRFGGYADFADVGIGAGHAAQEPTDDTRGRTGHDAAGVPAGGDPATGDRAHGNPAAGDPAARDPVAGVPAPGAIRATADTAESAFAHDATGGPQSGTGAAAVRFRHGP